MARRLIPKPKTIGEAAALVGKRVQITSWGVGETVRLRPEAGMAYTASWRLQIEGEVTGYHMTRSMLVSAFEITLAGYGAIDVIQPWAHIYRVLPPWRQRALIWLGLLARPHWY